MNNQKGFSLVELLIAIVIIGILAAVAVPQYNSYIAKSKESEASSVMAVIKKKNLDYRVGQKAQIPDAASRKWYSAATDFKKMGFQAASGTELSKYWDFSLSTATGYASGAVTATLKTGVNTKEGRCKELLLHYCWDITEATCMKCEGTCDADVRNPGNSIKNIGNYKDGTKCGTEDGEAGGGTP